MEYDEDMSDADIDSQHLIEEEKTQSLFLFDELQNQLHPDTKKSIINNQRSSIDDAINSFSSLHLQVRNVSSGIQQPFCL